MYTIFFITNVYLYSNEATGSKLHYGTYFERKRTWTLLIHHLIQNNYQQQDLLNDSPYLTKERLNATT